MDLVEHFVDHIAVQGESEAFAALGSEAPDFALPSSDGQYLRLSDFRGHPVVLAFFPADWDPSRSTQLGLFESAMRDAAVGARLVSVTCDGVWCDVSLVYDEPVRFPVLRDLGSNSEIARRFGVTGRQAIFVLDGEGIVRWRHVGPVGMYPPADEIASALENSMAKSGVSRRRLIATAIAATIAFALLPRLGDAFEGTHSESAVPGLRTIRLQVNGQSRTIEIDARVTLLDALRERLGLMGTKKGCDHGQCGACTVHVDGRRVNSCLTLAMQAEGSRITTIEGLARGERLHPVQAAFITHDGYQCGYCTPGQIMSAVACIQEGHAKTDEDIKEFMSGNICRCGAYVGICAAVKEGRDAMRGAR